MTFQEELAQEMTILHNRLKCIVASHRQRLFARRPDRVGIDVGIHTFPPMHEGYGEKFPVPVLFEKLLLAGRGGLKSGKGIYVNGLIDDEFFQIIQKIQSETG